MADAATAAAAAAQQGSGGLPQFDLAQWPGQILWTAVTFGLLLFVFARVFTPRIGGTIAEREDKISGDIGNARRLRDEAEAQSRAAAEELVQARARAQRVAADAKAAANAEAAARQAEEESRLAKVLAEAEGQINAARAEAMTQVRGIAAEAASAMVEKLTGREASASEVEQALASAS